MTVVDDIEHAAGSEGDNGRTRGKSLDAHDPEVVLGRKDEAARRREEGAECGVVSAPGEYDVLACDALESSALAAFADDQETQPDVVESAHGDLGALVCREPSDEKPEVAALVVRDE